MSIVILSWPRGELGVTTVDALRYASSMPAYRIASPCTADWDAMPGDGRIRHCPRCSLDVYNFSAMTPLEITLLIKDRTGRLCARFYQRADGTMLTQDCRAGAPARVSSSPLLVTAALAALVSIAPARASAVLQSPALASSTTQQTEDALSLVVRDPAGAVIGGAAVSLVNVVTREHFEARTNEIGQFSTSTLPAGTYDLIVTHAGFVESVGRGINPPMDLSITMTLQVAVMGEVVSIPEPLETAQSPQTLYEPDPIDYLPRWSGPSCGSIIRSVDAPVVQPSPHRSALHRFFSKLGHLFQF
jgi:Carboxypeptidase regulatory-like domain